jgi:hypothetical protein
MPPLPDAIILVLSPWCHFFRTESSARSECYC